ncbi:MAG: crossover junction endodeoxyribonuclease RuvC [Chloroflexi bacterium]|nr:crossover junction endodeoxyribonuclease RuvC [Chloroflexota bacterium]
MRVLGVDPGTIVTGFGVIEDAGGEARLVECGVIRAPAKQPIERRLLLIYEGLLNLVTRHRPDAVAVEEPFVVHAPRNAAMAVGEARAMALLAAAQRGLAISQYPPARVRSTVANYGAGDKEQVRLALTLQLGVDLNAYPLDATDALAVALCHLRHVALDAMMGSERVSARGRR